jgi:predicted DNA-binding transcriptional regulator AlpA
MRRDAEPKKVTAETRKLLAVASVFSGAGRPLQEREAAARVGVTGNCLAKWRCRRTGPRYVRFGRTIRYLEGDLNEWIAAHTVDPEQATGGAG